jgi:hypothetical protein
MILHLRIAMVAGWIQRHQQRVIAYLQGENRVLKAGLWVASEQKLTLCTYVIEFIGAKCKVCRPCTGG